jgi:hypothetical protein
MTTEGEEKDEKDAFAYSWYLPVKGRKARAGAQPSDRPTEEPSEQGPKPASEVFVEPTHTLAEPAQTQAASSSRPKEAFGPRFKVSSSLLRIAGLSVWSIISGVGMIALLVTQNPVPLTPVLALVGIWAVVSILIWSLPSKLTK